jgi:hypothetical protein
MSNLITQVNFNVGQKEYVLELEKFSMIKHAELRKIQDCYIRIEGEEVRYRYHPEECSTYSAPAQVSDAYHFFLEKFIQDDDSLRLDFEFHDMLRDILKIVVNNMPVTPPISSTSQP